MMKTGSRFAYILEKGSSTNHQRRGNNFPLGEQKLNNFSVGEAKIGEKQSRQSNSKYNFMHHPFFKKDISSVEWGLGQSPRSWGIFENFCVKGELNPENNMA